MTYWAAECHKSVVVKTASQCSRMSCIFKDHRLYLYFMKCGLYFEFVFHEVEAWVISVVTGWIGLLGYA